MNEELEKLKQEKAELLAALKKITKVNETNPVLVYQEMERIARAAIAKAERREG